MNNLLELIDIFGKYHKFTIYPINHIFSEEKDYGVIYIYLNNNELIYCGKDSNFPSRLNYHKKYDKNIVNSSTYIAICLVIPNELDNLEESILKANKFKLNVQHNCK